ncbi:hypothetical protein Zmor_015590 [Zophobas morio]|uniref:Cytochrome P450 n=1 Tax=Zophobas morio TaxID=2755281 RepID=A0AA38IEH8_9CUCU|nr:hypothetical protein Zmor_015590 [Zophobas morio]
MFVPVIELFLVFIFTTLVGFYIYYSHCFTYWKRKGVPQLNPTFPVGDLGLSALGKESLYVRLQTLYHKFKNGGHKFGGIYFFNGPIYFPVDPYFVKEVLVSKFDHFVDRGMYINVKKVPLSSNMFTMPGDDWKAIRAKLTPNFTSGKIKSMYNIVLEMSQNLLKTLKPLAEKELEVDMKDIFLRYIADVVGTTSFGIDVNSLKNPESEFSQTISKLFYLSPWKLFRLVVEEGLQNPGNINKLFMDNRSLENYFFDLVRDTIEYRDKNNVVRNDFLNILMQLRSTGMTFQEIVSEAVLFFTAGYETSSSVLSFCLHEFAHNEEIQDKARREIREKLGTESSKYTYDGILSLSYVDKCLKETMRKYPVVGMLNRQCVKTYQIPGTNVTINPGTPVIIPMLGLHRDPDYFPNPLKFDPERFNNEKNVTSFIYLPFGEGPRNCIGFRLGLIQTKLALAAVLNDFQFVPAQGSSRHLVIDPSTTSVVFSVKGGIYLKIKKI